MQDVRQTDIGDRFQVKDESGGLQWITVCDFPGDCTVITFKEFCDAELGGEHISGVVEADGEDDNTPIQVGWHIVHAGEMYEIVAIQEKEN
jgi:hypothetical protein